MSCLYCILPESGKPVLLAGISLRPNPSLSIKAGGNNIATNCDDTSESNFNTRLFSIELTTGGKRHAAPCGQCAV